VHTSAPGVSLMSGRCLRPALEALVRGGGSAALSDGGVFNLAVTLTEGSVCGGMGVEREAAALTRELVPFQAHFAGALENSDVGGRTSEFKETAGGPDDCAEGVKSCFCTVDGEVGRGDWS
jgi:hypothetical protein